MITEQLIEDLDLPDYYKWSEYIWDGDHWWDYIVDDFVAECDEFGVDIDSASISFDIYHRTCASGGEVITDSGFVKKYYDDLAGISPVLTQMVQEGMLKVSWGGYITVNVDDNWSEGEVFNSGLFAGTSVAELWEIDRHNFDDFEDCITAIIKDLHSDLLKELTSAYEWDTSEERYKESLLEQIHEAVWMQQQSTTVLNKTTTTGE
jgi:hypothetical protein